MPAAYFTTRCHIQVSNDHENQYPQTTCQKTVRRFAEHLDDRVLSKFLLVWVFLASHFTSWHGLLGFISTCIVLAQALFGMLIGFESSRDYILGDSLGRKLWKLHRLVFCLKDHLWGTTRSGRN